MNIIRGNAFSLPLKDSSVHCVVTSPPYYGLRRYSGLDDDHYGLEPELDCLGWARGERCNRCYVCHTVEVFKELWRVLHPTGVIFLNIGDAYAGSWGNYGGQNRGKGKQREILNGSQAVNPAYDGLEQWRPPTSYSQANLKPKDLCLVPARVALALQAAGWWVRSDIIWQKPSCMPGSQTDRPTSSYEHVFLLAKNSTYYFDMSAVREPQTGNAHSRGTKLRPPKEASNTAAGNGHKDWDKYTSFNGDMGGRALRDVWTINSEPNSWATCENCHYVSERWPKCPWCGGAVVNESQARFGPKDNAGIRPTNVTETGGLHTEEYRGRNSIYLPSGYDECPRCHGRQTCPRCRGTKITAHYAAFPTALPELCIKAGTSEKGVCGECGAPWIRTTETKYLSAPNYKANEIDRYNAGRGRNVKRMGDGKEVSTLSWQPFCSHNAPVVPAIVLDCFAGSGSTLIAAERLGRRSIGIELSPSYIRIAQARGSQRSLFTSAVAAPPRIVQE